MNPSFDGSVYYPFLAVARLIQNNFHPVKEKVIGLLVCWLFWVTKALEDEATEDEALEDETLEDEAIEEARDS